MTARRARIDGALIMLLLCLVQGSFVPPPAGAWGEKAHRITADVAESLLDRRTRAIIEHLVGPEGLVGVATWADEVRATKPETSPWHYVNIPRGHTNYNPRRHCATPTDGDCVVAAIQRFQDQLADPSQPRSARAEALKFLTHFVADVHQPLHCIADFRGGNETLVVFLGKKDNPASRAPWNLHAVWDAGLVEQAGLPERDYRERLLEWLRSHPPSDVQMDGPADWALESHHLALEVAMKLPARNRIGGAYVRRSRAVVDRQLALAGFRLARMLRAALSQDPR